MPLKVSLPQVSYSVFIVRLLAEKKEKKKNTRGCLFTVNYLCVFK